MAIDDPTKVKLPSLNVPGMQSPPPPQPVGLDPLEGVKTLARDVANGVRGQFAPQPAPPVAPLLGPDAGRTILPALQAADTYMRGKQDAAISNARGVPGTVMQGVQSLVDAATPPSSNYVGNGPTDPDVNGRKPAPGVDLKVVAGQLMDKAGEAIGGSDYLRPRTPAPTYNAFAARPILPAETPAQGGAAPSAPALIAASPATGAPAPGAQPAKDNFDKQVQLASLISAQNNNRTPVPNPYEGPAAGVAPPASGVHGSIGVEGFQKQLANIQALQTPAPPTGGAAGAETETWQEKYNREVGEKWAREDQMRVLKGINPNTAGGRAQLAALGHLMSSDASAAASKFGALTAAGASTSNAATAAQSARERDAANLQATGMQVAGQDKSSQRTADTSIYGHNVRANTALQNALLQAQTALHGHQVQADNNAATNAAALERTQIMADEGRYRTDQTARTAENNLIANLNALTPHPMNPGVLTNKAGQEVVPVRLGAPKPKPKSDKDAK